MKPRRRRACRQPEVIDIAPTADLRHKGQRSGHDMHVPRGTQQSDDPDSDEAVHAVEPRLLEEAGEPRSGLQMFVAYYNFCWRTRLPGKSGRYRVPAAMAVRVIDSLWSFEDLSDRVTGESHAIAA